MTGAAESIDRGFRPVVKAIARGAALIAVFPLLLSFWVRRPLIGANRALEGSTQLLALAPGIIGQYLRRAFLAQTLAACDATATVAFGTVFSDVDARLDAYCYVGPGCHLGRAHIQRDVLLGAGVHVPSGPHIHGIDRLDIPIRLQPGHHRTVTIGEGSWIGSAAVIMADIGAQSVVGAGAVVVKPLPPRVIAGGVPAKVLGAREARSTAEVSAADS